jgi:hypothetical protein
MNANEWRAATSELLTQLHTAIEANTHRGEVFRLALRLRDAIRGIDRDSKFSGLNLAVMIECRDTERESAI